MIAFIPLYSPIGGLGDPTSTPSEIISFILCDSAKETNNNNTILKAKYWALNMSIYIYINILINTF